MLQLQARLVDGLRTAGVKITSQRKAICEWLEGDTTHPSASSVYDALKDTTPGLSLATVYNTLSLLIELDLIHEVTHHPDGSVRYDTNTVPHLNLVCSRCGEILDQPIPLLQVEALNQLAQFQDFAVRDAIVVLHGICRQCLAKDLDK
jgi:Fur family transcriptional regulator, peroxide stress response regulator